MGRFVRYSSLLFLSGLLTICVHSYAQKALSHEEARALDHQNPVWESVRAHLPDPTTATAVQLESAADVLRARRFLEDAIDYYGFALQRGGE
jgi:hypothetical protein